MDFRDHCTSELNEKLVYYETFNRLTVSLQDVKGTVLTFFLVIFFPSLQIFTLKGKKCE